ncbi:Protein FAR1-RELATED SEQUENCE 7, partial [Bienertia sinuspersici]
GDFSCSCKLFEFRGILCRHIIKIIEFEDVNVIPKRYILSRWRMDIVRPYEDIRVSYYDPEEFDRVKRVRKLSQRHYYLSSLALHSDETFLMYKETTDDVRAMLEEALGIERTDGEGGGWWDPSVRKVYGRLCIRPKDQNQRHLTKNAAPQPEGGTKDPVDKRHNGRGTKTGNLTCPKRVQRLRRGRMGGKITIGRRRMTLLTTCHHKPSMMVYKWTHTLIFKQVLAMEIQLTMVTHLLVALICVI